MIKKVIYLFCVGVTILMANDQTDGCTDPTACNYNDDPSVNTDNTLCIYADNICETCSEETDGTGIIVDNDDDDDEICNADDNCPNEQNSNQDDTDGDSLGDICDQFPYGSLIIQLYLINDETFEMQFFFDDGATSAGISGYEFQIMGLSLLDLECPAQFETCTLIPEYGGQVIAGSVENSLPCCEGSLATLIFNPELTSTVAMILNLAVWDTWGNEINIQPIVYPDNPDGGGFSIPPCTNSDEDNICDVIDMNIFQTTAVTTQEDFDSNSATLQEDFEFTFEFYDEDCSDDECQPIGDYTYELAGSASTWLSGSDIEFDDRNYIGISIEDSLAYYTIVLSGIPDDTNINDNNLIIHIEDGQFIMEEEYTILISSCLTGDMNGDSFYDVLDVVTLINCVLVGNCLDFFCDVAGDLNGDNTHNVLDVVMLINCILSDTCGDI